MGKVGKFGGSSLKTAAHIKKCVQLVHRHGYQAVVVSALGKTTRQLLDLLQTKNAQIYTAISNTHIETANQLDASGALTQKIEKILTQLTHDLTHCDNTRQTQDKILSYGEKLSATLFAHTADMPFADSRLIIQTDATFGEAIPQNITPPPGPFVTQGFIGATKSGSTTTLGFEGSDYSAALIAQALHATQLDIWTDVPGIFAADPNVIDYAAHIPFLSYQQMATLARMGAKVLHPKTMKPLQENGIPLHVKSSHIWARPGSIIHKTPVPNFIAFSTIGPSTLTIMGRSPQEVSDALPNHKITEVDGFLSVAVDAKNLKNEQTLVYDLLCQTAEMQKVPAQ